MEGTPRKRQRLVANSICTGSWNNETEWADSTTLHDPSLGGTISYADPVHHSVSQLDHNVSTQHDHCLDKSASSLDPTHHPQSLLDLSALTDSNHLEVPYLWESQPTKRDNQDSGLGSQMLPGSQLENRMPMMLLPPPPPPPRAMPSYATDTWEREAGVVHNTSLQDHSLAKTPSSSYHTYHSQNPSDWAAQSLTKTVSYADPVSTSQISPFDGIASTKDDHVDETSSSSNSKASHHSPSPLHCIASSQSDVLAAALAKVAYLWESQPNGRDIQDSGEDSHMLPGSQPEDRISVCLLPLTKTVTSHATGAWHSEAGWSDSTPLQDCSLNRTLPSTNPANYHQTLLDWIDRWFDEIESSADPVSTSEISQLDCITSTKDDYIVDETSSSSNSKPSHHSQSPLHCIASSQHDGIEIVEKQLKEVQPADRLAQE